jgi:hypothetical protein
MAGRKDNGSGDEFAGTGPDDNGPGGALDPAALPGADAGAGGSGDDFDPAIHVGREQRNGDGSYTRKRGRKAGSGTGSAKAGSRSSAADLKFAVENLSKTLVIIHSGIAAATQTPEMMIDSEEGDLLAKSAANVLEQFDMTPDPKLQAAVGMIVACAVVYGPRVALIRARKALQE